MYVVIFTAYARNGLEIFGPFDTRANAQRYAESDGGLAWRLVVKLQQSERYVGDGLYKPGIGQLIECADGRYSVNRE